MTFVVKLVQRLVAIIVAAFSLSIFVPVGGFFYVVLITRAVLSLTLSSFVSAMTGAIVESNIKSTLEQSIAFFPSGLAIIWNISKSIWNGEVSERASSRPDKIVFMTNILLAILFFVAVLWTLEFFGIPSVKVSRILGWLLDAPILILLSMIFFAMAFYVFWQSIKSRLIKIRDEIDQQAAARQSPSKTVLDGRISPPPAGGAGG